MRELRVEVKNATLSVWVIDPPTPRATVVVLHGIGDRKASMLDWGLALTRQGIRAVLVDHRGHGDSTGERLGYGALESEDCMRVLDALERQGLRAGRVGVWGVSYGAATAILWAARDPRVSAVAALAPFAALDEIVPRYFGRMLPLTSRIVPGFVLSAVVWRGGRLAGFHPKDARPVDAAAKLSAPLLLIHGRQDSHIPPSDSQRIAAAANVEVRLFDADHNGIGSVPEVVPAVLAHFRRHLNIID